MAVLALKPEPVDAITDPKRLDALARYDVLDTPREEAFERIANLMKMILKTDVTIVSMIDGHRQWFKAGNGNAFGEVPVRDSFCQVTIQGDDAIAVPDATLDPRFRDNPYVTGDAHVRSYLGTPLKTQDGQNIGTLCAYGREPQEFSEDQKAIITELAKVAMNELELRRLAHSDGLTGVMTRRAFKDEANRLVALARRHRTRLAAVAFDIDHFKSVNDTYGHATGDRVLTTITKAITSQMRRSDVFGRLGGEEFAILLPDTDAASALAIAEKLRIVVRALKFANVFPALTVSASFGVALLDPGTDDTDALLVKTDEAVYDAKRQGRNRSVLWHGGSTSATRTVERRRVLKAGRLIFNNKLSSIECTVRALWDTGAELSVSSTVGVPDELTLQMTSDGFEWRAKVTDRRPTSLELSFA